MSIQNHSLVSIHYTLYDADAEGDKPIDTTEGKAPVTYLHGANQIVSGLERALAGKQAGDEFDVTLAPADAFGDYRQDQVQTVPKTLFKETDMIASGAKVSARNERGVLNFLVRSVDGDQVTVDGNHPLAGRRLRFRGVVVSTSQTRPVDAD